MVRCCRTFGEFGGDGKDKGRERIRSQKSELTRTPAVDQWLLILPLGSFQRDCMSHSRELSVFAEALSRLAVPAAAWAVWLVLCVALTGCSNFKQFGKDRPPDHSNAGGAAPPRFPTGGSADQGIAGNSTPMNSVTNQANQGAILAGRVIDSYSRPPANTSIRWVSLDDKKDAENDISVTPEGYFTIQGLKANGHYKLIARGRQGDRLVAGVSYTTAPNIRVLIQVKEDLANGNTPP